MTKNDPRPARPAAPPAAPPAAAPEAVPWARQSISTEPPATSRARRHVDSLPSWEPLPPGEILVRRSPQP